VTEPGQQVVPRRRLPAYARWLRAQSARTPLRLKLVAALLALVTVALAVTGFAATTALRGYLVGQVDDDLLHGRLDVERSRDGGPDQSPFGPSRDEYLRVTTPDGVVLGERRTDADGPAPRLPRGRVHVDEPFTVPSSGEGPTWRAVARAARLPDGTPVTAFHAISLGDVTDTLDRLVLIETAVGLVVLVLLAGVAYVVVRSNLRPLVEVESTAAAIAGGDLSRRVPEGDPRTEVGRLSRALNGMLGQIEEAFRARERSEGAARASEERMRRFVADASHELRTPLTSIRGFAELYRQGAVQPGELDRVMRRVEDEAARMGLLVEDLLLLARLDQQRPIARAPVDLLAVASDAVHDAGAVAPGRSVSLVAREDGPPPLVLGDEARLRQVVSNLVSNAITHTPDGTPVTVRVGATDDGHVVLQVEDRGPGLPPDEARRVFERFYRADPSRTRSAGGTGLGLSIVAALVAAHGGTVSVDTAVGAGCTFTVRLPLHAAGVPSVV
jgi:two-component system OmpR family sensor kinase